MNFQAAVVQMRSGRDPARNIADVSGFIDEAVARGAKLVLTPEMTNIIETDRERLNAIVREEKKDASIPIFAERAQRHRAWILAGSLALHGEAGKLNFSDVRVSGNTGTSEARAELPNPGGLLHPGQFVRVTLKGAQRPGAIMVPQRAVLEGPKGKFVYVVNSESRAEPRPVELGDWQGNAWIVTAGLNPGDKVIVDGVMKIGPGAPVSVAAAQEGDQAKSPPQAVGEGPKSGEPSLAVAKK